MTSNSNKNPMLWEKQTQTINVNWHAEIVQTFDGSYYINLWIDKQAVAGLPEYVRYSTLRSAVKRSVGIELPKQSELHFVKTGNKRYASLSS